MTLALMLVLARPSPGAHTTEPTAGLLQHWRAAGIKPEIFYFDPAHDDQEIAADLIQRVHAHCEANSRDRSSLVLGGYSRGARMAAQVAQRLEAAALLCLAFPFHKRRDPTDRHGLAHLQELTIPTLVVQGSRDAHGNREQVRGYQHIPSCVQLHWLEGGNHHYQVGQSAAASNQELLESAAKATMEFFSRLSQEGQHAGS